MASTPRPLLGAVALTLFTIVGESFLGCSGKTAPDDAAASSGGPGGNTDGGEAKNNPACPANAPDQATSCSKEGLLCEYGDDFVPACNTLRVCSEGRWASPITGGDAQCGLPAPTVAPNPSDCAPTRASVPDGQACSSTSVCSYDGAICSCGTHCPNYPVRPRDCDADAGVTTGCCDTTKVTWGCFEGPPYCPANRPRVGSACTAADQPCALAPPAECGQAILQCTNGVWTEPFATCPISTAKAKREIAYADGAAIDRLHDDLMSVKLASYRYKPNVAADDARHLGFVIEDMPEGSPAVLASRDRVDLYGYASMAVASLQHQQREIDALKAEVARLAAENAAMKRAARH